MTDLAEFLLARIAEDEDLARSALPLPDGIERVAPVRQDRSRSGWVGFEANGEESLLLAPTSPDSPLAEPLGDWGWNGGPIDHDDREFREIAKIFGDEPGSGVEILPYNVLDAGGWDEEEPIGGAYYVAHIPGRCPPGVARHIATWDPMRVLVECHAKREIVDYENGSDQTVLLRMAAVYRDHPDYQPEWRY